MYIVNLTHIFNCTYASVFMKSEVTASLNNFWLFAHIRAGPKY